MRISLAVIVLLAGAAQLSGQDPKKKDPNAPDPRRIDQAIDKGIEFLRGAESPSGPDGIANSNELILLTLIHGNVPVRDAKVGDLLEAMLAAPLEHTYSVALQAMVLEEIDRRKYQGRLFQCAQFLVDNQCRNGQWSYGKATLMPDLPVGTPTAAAKEIKTGTRDFSSPPSTEKPKVVRRLPVKRQREGPADGDNSNSQYAALGLRACHDAGILLPRETCEQALAWWKESQKKEEDKKEAKDRKKKEVATGGGVAAKALGWGYKGPGDEWGSMTAGAVGAVAIYDYILDRNWKQDEVIADGVAWLGSHFSVTENPRKNEWHYYYLYGLERAGVLCGTELFGAHAWYNEGAKFLLESQKPDGSWSGSDGKDTWSTCFAILFLKRATRPLDVATGSGRGNK